MRLGISNFNPGLSSLTRTTAAIARSLERLSSGSRVVHPRDDFASYSLGLTLMNQWRGLTQGIQNLNDARGLVESADAGIGSQIDLVSRMREIALQASSSIISSSERSQLQTELKELVKEFQRISSDTRWRDMNLLDGSQSSLQISDGSPDGLLQVDLDSSTPNDQFRKWVGTGTYESRITQSNAGLTFAPLYGDVNGDGNVDMVIGTIGSAGSQVFFGDGRGTFTVTHSFITSSSSSPVLADFTGDGILDYVAARGGSDYFSINEGRGDGTFSAEATFLTQASISELTSGDFDNDGDLDIAIRATSPDISILENDGTGSFTTVATVTDTGAFNISLGFAMIDVNNDQLDDLVTWNSAFALNYYLSDGSGQFGAETLVGSVVASYLWTGDIGGDGDQDLIFLNAAANNINIKENTGSGFSTTTVTPVGTNHREAIVRDLNGDGIPDLAVLGITDDYITLFMGQGGAAFSAGKTVAVSSTATRFGITDVNRDGVFDILTQDAANGISLFKGRGQEISAVSDLSVASQQSASNLIEILDSTLERLNSNRGRLGALHSQLDAREASNLLLADTVAEARDRTTELNYALELADLVRNQILQQAQIAIQTQANLNQRIVLSLLSTLDD